MARAAVVETVMAFLAAEWTEPDCPVRPINVSEQTPGGDFVEVQFPVARPTRMSVGTRYYREDGTIRLVIHNATGTGTATATRRADAMADLFRDRHLGGGIVKCQVPTSPPLDDFNDTGPYFVVAVLVPYTHDYRDE